MQDQEKSSKTSVEGGESSPVKQKYTFFQAVCLILTCFSGMVVTSICNTSVSIALPAIGRDLHIAQDRLQWVVSAYALSSGCFLLLCGRLADLHGRKHVFLLGTAWTGIFALGCGFAQTEIQINILRGIQGIGSAAIIPAALGILAHAFPPSRLQSIAFSAFSAGAPFGGGVGFTLGAVVTQYAPATWRGTFFMTAGCSAVPLLVGIFSICADEPSNEGDRRVDWVGAALVTAGLVLVTFVLGQGELAENGWKTPYIIILLLAGVLLIVAFNVYEHYLVTRTSRSPLMRLDLWTRANGKFAAMQGIAFLQWCAFMSWTLWAQLYYQTYQNYTPMGAMLRLLPMTITGLILNFIVSIVVGSLDVLWLLIIGTTATGGACLLFALINPSAAYWAFGFPAAILTVWGADFIFACGTLFVARVAHAHEQSVAGGLFQTLTQLGTSFGLAITTIAHNKTLRKETAAAGIIPDATASNAPREAQLKGFKAAQWAGFGFAMAGLLLALLFLRNVGVVGGKKAESPIAVQPAEKQQPKETGVNGEETTPHSEE